MDGGAGWCDAERCDPADLVIIMGGRVDQSSPCFSKQLLPLMASFALHLVTPSTLLSLTLSPSLPLTGSISSCGQGQLRACQFWLAASSRWGLGWLSRILSRYFWKCYRKIPTRLTLDKHLQRNFFHRHTRLQKITLYKADTVAPKICDFFLGNVTKCCWNI